MFIYIISSVLIVLLDQITKVISSSSFSVGEVKTIIPGLLSFTSVKNTGAAFGMLSGARVFFIILTVAVLIWATVYIFKSRPSSLLEKLALCSLIGGAVGNFIDRLFLGYVRDFIMVTFIDFPVFNIADCFVCIGAGLYVVFAFSDLFNKKGTDASNEQ